MFDGYLAFSGTEIINSARTRAYLQNFLPTLAPGSCCECDDLAGALGDNDYSSPMQDQAPWFSEYRTESQEFYGLFPLALEGFEDSTLRTPVVEVTGDGGTFGRARRSTKVLRIRGLAMAASEKAMDFGLSWLRDVLSGSPCTDGNCAGDTLCFLTECPEPCDWSTSPTTIFDEPYVTEADPAPYLASWTANGPGVTAAAPGGGLALRWDNTGGVLTVQREMRDLIPGAPYRVTLGAYGASPAGAVTVTIPGAAGSLTINPIPSTGVLAEPLAGGVGVLTFVATSSTHRLVLSTESDLVLTTASVERTGPGLLALTTQPDAHPDEAFAWVQNWAAAASNYVGVYSGATWSFQAPTGTVAVAAGALGVERRITGLTPGQPYTITAAVNSETSTGTALGAVLSVVGLTGSASGAASTISSTVKGGWLTLTFTPTAASHVVRVAQRDALTLTTGGARVGVNYLRVEETNPTIVDPMTDNDVWRFYRNVSVQQGLSVIGVYPERSGVLREIEVIFVAGNPQPVGEEILVSTSLGAGVSVVPEIPCSNGAAVRHNLALNPSFEVNASNTFTLTSGATATVARVADATAPRGAYTLRLTSSAAGSSTKVISYAANTPVPGMVNAFSFMWTSNLANMNITVTARAYRTAPDSSLISTTTVATGVLREALTWQPLSFLYTPPPGAGTVAYDITVTHTWTNGGYLGIDTVLEERSQVVRPYFDGTYPDATWDGTAGASRSTYSKTSTAIIVDPDCPPPPAAPRPPIIDDSCVSPAATWVRHAIEMPAQFTALSPKVVPVAALTTGSTAARGVRVRVYANPFSRGAADLDPCAYCGEFLLSYLPPNSVLTVDSSTRAVTVTTAGQSVSALNLLYGSDGGPMTWPEMDCGIPYIITIDLDATTSPLVNLALSVVPVY